jgi:hypothetical protein
VVTSRRISCRRAMSNCASIDFSIIGRLAEALGAEPAELLKLPTGNNRAKQPTRPE